MCGGGKDVHSDGVLSSQLTVICDGDLLSWT